MLLLMKAINDEPLHLATIITHQNNHIKGRASNTRHYFGNKVSKTLTISGQYIKHELATLFDQKEVQAFLRSAAILNGNVQ